jgi:hypothetical protein
VAKVIGGFKCPYTKRIYHVGDEYDGQHLEEMQKKGYVEKTAVKEDKPEWPKHIAGGLYELSNGDRVKGKEAAIAAQAEIDARTEADEQETEDNNIEE